MNITHPEQIKSFFKGSFLASPETLLAKLHHIKAFVFDWDGVFNAGFKDAGGSSPFNEIDSMGINMMRFNHFIRKGENPVMAVISGEHNAAALFLSKREHFHCVYSGIRNKKDALLHFCSVHNIKPEEIAFFFDDILDLSLAPICGLRILVGRESNPMFNNLVQTNELADYITANDGGHNAIREAAELIIGITGRYNNTIMQRVAWSDNYQHYITERNTITTNYFIHSGTEITEHLF